MEMKLLLRKLRGVAGIGATWGLVTAAVFATLALIIGYIDPDSGDPGDTPLWIAYIGASVGFISGACFGAMLAVAESRNTILKVPLWRAAMWGVLASAIFPLLTGKADQLIVL